MEEVATGLAYPSAIVWLPNGDALVAEREGGLRLIHQDELDPRPLQGLPASFQNIYNGIKDLLLDPDFATTRRLYLLISEGTLEMHHAAVYEGRLVDGELTAVKRVFRSRDDIGGIGASAGRMLWLADGTLLVGVPEDDLHKKMAQDLRSHIGKVLRIEPDGTVPSDNPFLKVPGALPEIWSYGHRVQTGLYRDPNTNEVWEVEPGPRGGDELNVLGSGKNFGWARASWGFDYSGKLAAPMQFAPDIEDPVFIWMSSSTPSGTPSGLTRYRGKAFPQWDSDFFVGLLSGRSLDRLRITARTVVLRERLLMDLEERIRDVRVGPDEYIYVLTDHPLGRVLRIRPGHPAVDQQTRVARKLSPDLARPSGELVLDTSDDQSSGRRSFVEHCAQCHKVGLSVRGGSLGPDLKGVIGRNAGTFPGFRYSMALSNSPQVWSALSLDLFLADPNGYAPGTSMVAPPVVDVNIRHRIISFLESTATRRAPPKRHTEHPHAADPP